MNPGLSKKHGLILAFFTLVILFVVPMFPHEATYEVESNEAIQLFTVSYRATVIIRNTDDFGGVFGVTDRIYAKRDLNYTSPIPYPTLTMSEYIGPGDIKTFTKDFRYNTVDNYERIGIVEVSPPKTTRSLLQMLLISISRQSPSNPTPLVTPTPQPLILKVEASLQRGEWIRDPSTDLPSYEVDLVYSITNLSDKTIRNASLTIFDKSGVLLKSGVDLYPCKPFNGTLTLLTSYDSIRPIYVNVVSSTSLGGRDLLISAFIPRTFEGQVNRRYITLDDPEIKELLQKISPSVSSSDWITIKDWVANHIQYKNDSEAHGVSDYWQLPRETLKLGTGDCEDFSLLLCSLYRAAGYSPDQVYVVLGEKFEDWHAWLKIKVDDDWYYLDPQVSKLETLVVDRPYFSGFQARYELNDIHFEGIG